MTYKFEKALHVLGWFESGSRVICDPPVEDTDHDIVIYTDAKYILQKELESLGYTYSNKDVEKYKLKQTDPFQMYNSFDAYRHPDTDENLVVVNSTADYLRWKVATLVAKQLNVTNKDDRITLFRAIRSGGKVYQKIVNGEPDES